MPINQDYNQFLRELSSHKFQTLRNAQEYALRIYSERFTNTADVAIELPTGSGKTLISLLIAEAWRREGNKVAILSANKTLARQMKSEADALGLPVVLMEGRGQDIPAVDKRSYQRAISIAIMNYWVYFNQHPVIDPSSLLIMDDAHLAEHCLHSLYSVEIKKSVHSILFRTLVAELQSRFPEYSVLADAIIDDSPPTRATELFSFIDQIQVINRIREIVDASPVLATDTDLRFRWMRMRDNLSETNIYFSLNSIWIRPYIYPLIANMHYSQTRQRLYMSATIGDTGDLARRLGVQPITKIPILPEHAEKTSGRRMIVMNRIEEKDIPQKLAEVILSALRIHPKSVWLCSGETEAKHYQNAVSDWLNANGFVGHPTWLLTPLGDEIEQFKLATNGHLFVGGRFDGMDFKADECRLVVLTTLPHAINSQEEFISSYLRDSGFMLRRLNQRIIQALGRCNRADEDFGVYVLADRRFAVHHGRESQKEGLPRNIIAEIDMAQDSADLPSASLVDMTEKFLRGDFATYDEAFRNYYEQVPVQTEGTRILDTSNDEVMGWVELHGSKNYSLAADKFEHCWENSRTEGRHEITALYGWQWAKALFLQSILGDPGAKVRSLSVLEEAIRHGGFSSWFNRMRASLNRARQDNTQATQLIRDEYSEAVISSFDTMLEKVGATGDRFEKWCNRTNELLESVSHAEYQEGLERLGQLIGYQATRPRYNTATDCRWRGVFANVKEVITFEAKIEHSDGQVVSATWLGQAHNQNTRAINEFSGNGYTVRSVIVSHITTIDAAAEASAGQIKIISKESILTLWQNVKVILSRYRDSWSLHDFNVRTQAANQLRTKIPHTGWLTDSIDTPERLIPSTILCAEWTIR